MATPMPSGHPAGCPCWWCVEDRTGDDDGLGDFRSRTVDPTTCPHPDDERMPLSADDWMCEHCGAIVPEPADVMRAPRSKK